MGSSHCAARSLPAAQPAARTAKRSLREALTVAEALGMRPLERHCHPGLARIWRRLAGDVEAKEHFTAATRVYRDLGMAWWLNQSAQLAQG